MADPRLHARTLDNFQHSLDPDIFPSTYPFLKEYIQGGNVLHPLDNLEHNVDDKKVITHQHIA